MIKVIHNGYDAKFFDTEQEAQRFLDSRVDTYKDLNPRCICNKVITTTEGKEQLIIYQYYTLYREVFEIIYAK